MSDSILFLNERQQNLFSFCNSSKEIDMMNWKVKSHDTYQLICSAHEKEKIDVKQ